MAENNLPKQEATLLLEDGLSFKGYLIGKSGTTGGEICFNTGMTGYQEIYTDPSYFGQIIVNTNAHIGNYGVMDNEQESDFPKISGLVVNDFSELFSRLTANESLQEYLVSHNITGITGVDTRKIVRHIRSKGAMNCVISSEINDETELKKELEKVPDMNALELSTKVTTGDPYFFGEEDAEVKIAVLDIGVKKSILRNFAQRGCYCKVYPAETSYEEMEKWNPDGYFLSNGPGDPAAMDYAVENVKKMLGDKKPVFGICLGHQLLARACGVDTYKMHHGHRGINHPVKNLKTGRSEITSQNHGFGVDHDEIEKADNLEITHINLNDNTVEGIRVLDKPAFSVQYHPESSPGPHDSRYLFDDFINLIKNNK